ncbi:MAG: hypothetical protein ABI551_10365, partial [Polyangiaceae bacterium]
MRVLATMSFDLSKRTLAPFFLAACTATLLNCGGGKQEDFTTEGDTAVTSGIVGTWEGTSSDGRAFLLTVCEDDSDRESMLSCETLHHVKGNGQGATETTEEPTGGCNGGCDYDYSLYVAGTIEGTDVLPTSFEAQFNLGGGDKNGLPFPYDVEGSSNGMRGGSEGVSFSGQMPGPDTFTLATLSYPASAASNDGGTRDVDASESDAGSGDLDSGVPAPVPSASGSAS